MTGPAGSTRQVGIDVGGTKAQGVALDADGSIVDTAHRPTPRGPGSLPALIDTLEAIAGELGPGLPVGVGVPGLVTPSGVLRAAPNLDGVADFPVGELLSERLGVPVAVDSDATCALIGESRLGVAAGFADVLMVTLGTGIGGGVMAGGEIQRGGNGFAGEFGHMVVDPNGVPCPCGRRGCWERYASGTGLAMLARDSAVGGRLAHVVEAAGGDPEAVRGEDVQRAAEAGDTDARAVIDEFGRWVAIGLANLTNAFDPSMIVLGGGLAAGADLYLGPIERWFRELIYQPDLRTLPLLRFGALGSKAGAVGAALLTRDER